MAMTCAGALAQLTIAVCGSPTNTFYSGWYCSRSKLARNLVTAVVPSILVTVYRSVAAVHLYYRCGPTSCACDGALVVLSQASP